METQRAAQALCLILVVVAGAGNAVATDAGSVSRLTRPLADEGPTRVSAGLYLVDLVDIDDAGQVLTADFVVWLRWSDPRLAARDVALTHFSTDEVWTPRLLILHERMLRRNMPEFVDVDADGNVLYRQRYTGTITSVTDPRR